MLSVVVINHNTPDITLRCLDLVYKSRKEKMEVILVDNTPEDGTAKRVKKYFPKTKIISNKSRLGFAANNNKAMKAAKGELVLLLNSDAFVEKETIGLCLKLIESRKWDVVGCKLMYPDGTIQPTYGYFPTLWRVIMLMNFVDNFPVVRKWVSSIHVRDMSRYENEREVDWVQGAFMMLRREIFEKTGGFDEKFFMYGEEIEWQYRIKQSGYRIGYVPQSRAVHLVGASTKSKSKMFLSEMEGYIYFFQKHRPVWEQKLLPWVLLWGCLIRIPAWAVWGKWDLVKAYWEILPRLLFATFGKSK